MTPLEERLIRRLIEDPASLSRNRHFETFEDPDLRRARRTARLLAHLLGEFAGGVRVRATETLDGETQERIALHLEDDSRALRRRVVLSFAEFRLLRTLGAPLPPLPGEGTAP